MRLIENKSRYNVIIPSCTPGGQQHSIPPNATGQVPDEDWEAYSTRDNPLLIKRGYLVETDRARTKYVATELDGMHHKTAVAHVGQLEDLDHLEALLAREKRPSVRGAISHRLKELMA